MNKFMKLEDRLEGAIGERGQFLGYTNDGKKDAVYRRHHIDWEKHFSGKEFLGLSPVKIIQNGNARKGVCRWIAWDLDIDLSPEDFCRIVFKINPEFFCYKTSSGRWHIHHYLDDWTDVDECRKIASEYENKFKKVWKKGVDTSHSLPKGYNVEEGKPGGWLFLPYCPHPELKNKELCSYSPSGNSLSKSQTEFAINWRKYPIIRSMVGSLSGEGGREWRLLLAKMVIVHNNLDLTPYEVNEQFNEPLTEPYLTRNVIQKHEKKDFEGEFTKQYLQEHTEKYLKDINGYWRKELKGVGVLDGFTDPEQEEKVEEFLKNIIYIKNDDLWYDKTTGKEYSSKALQVTYGYIFNGKLNDVIKTFSANQGAQLVEQTVYRPD